MFSSETMETRSQWYNIFQLLRKKKISVQNLTFRENIPQECEEIKTFSREEKLREFVTSRPTLKEWLKEALYEERK